VSFGWHGALDGAAAANNSSLPEGQKDQYVTWLVIDPVITLWNPYNVSMRFTGGRIDLYRVPLAFRLYKNGQLINSEYTHLANSFLGTDMGNRNDTYYRLNLLPDYGKSEIVLAPGEHVVLTASNHVKHFGHEYQKVGLDLRPGFSPPAGNASTAGGNGGNGGAGGLGGATAGNGGNFEAKGHAGFTSLECNGGQAAASVLGGDAGTAGTAGTVTFRAGVSTGEISQVDGPFDAGGSAPAGDVNLFLTGHCTIGTIVMSARAGTYIRRDQSFQNPVVLKVDALPAKSTLNDVAGTATGDVSGSLNGLFITGTGGTWYSLAGTIVP
jgi:hypothetical protein